MAEHASLQINHRIPSRWSPQPPSLPPIKNVIETGRTPFLTDHVQL